MKKTPAIPVQLKPDMHRAVRLEWWNIAFTISIVLVMGLVLGNSQTMKTAWIEDTLGLIPPIVFLIAIQYERRGATRDFPFGFARVHSLAFLIAAVALLLVGLFLVKDAVMTLIAREHATVASITLFGRTLWLGWLMIAAQFYAIIPPLIIGHLEQPLAIRLQDEVLFTDSKMNKANWQTGMAGIVGVIGLGLGYWWTDSVAAAFISVGIISDGWKALRIATAELVDGRPRELGSTRPDEEARLLVSKLEAQFEGADIRLREIGRYIHAEVRNVTPDHRQDLPALWPGDPRRCWRLAQLSFVPPDAEAEDVPAREGSDSPSAGP
jgi:divalent metal cation (Fe/Co/Zn/Cd) transporter